MKPRAVTGTVGLNQKQLAKDLSRGTMRPSIGLREESAGDPGTDTKENLTVIRRWAEKR
jgi:hypothetical protein